MKLRAIVLASLLMASAFCLSDREYFTVNEAFSTNLGQKGELQNLGEIMWGEVKHTEIIFETPFETIAQKLTSEGLHPGLAAMIAAQTTKPQAGSFAIRFVGPATYKVDDSTHQMAACVYKLDKAGSMNFICLASQGKSTPESELSIINKMRASLLTLYHSLQNKFRKFHAFTTKGFKTIFNLGLTKESELDQFFEDNAQKKDEAWQDIYNNKDDPFVVKLFKNGITYYSSTSDIDLVEGIEENLLKEYTEYLIQKLRVEAKYQQKIRDEIELASLGSMGDWREMEFIFKNMMGSAKYTMILTVQNPKTSEFDFLVLDINGSFAIGDDVLIYVKTKKILFGLWSKQEVVVVRTPATLNENVIKVLFNFYKFAALDSFNKFRKGVSASRS